jgi:hypothetical protein
MNRDQFVIKMSGYIREYNNDFSGGEENIFGLTLMYLNKKNEVLPIMNGPTLGTNLEICSLIPRYSEDQVIRRFTWVDTAIYIEEMEIAKQDFKIVLNVLLKIFQGQRVEEFYRLKGMSIPMSRINELEDIIHVRMNLRVA